MDAQKLKQVEEALNRAASFSSASSPSIALTFINAALSLIREEQAAPPVAQPVDVRAMVNRFLGWKLPANFGPDAGISFKRYMPQQTPDSYLWPVGTNLFTADQAQEMFEYALAASPQPEDATTDQLLELAGALEQRRALQIVENVHNERIGGRTALMPTAFQAGYCMACEEIEHRLRTEVWGGCLPPVGADKSAAPSNRGDKTAEPAVLAWRNAYAAYLAASNAYNTRLQAIRAREAMHPLEFGRESAHAEWKAIDTTRSAWLALLGPMFDALSALPAGQQGGAR